METHRQRRNRWRDAWQDLWKKKARDYTAWWYAHSER